MRLDDSLDFLVFNLVRGCQINELELSSVLMHFAGEDILDKRNDKQRG